MVKLNDPMTQVRQHRKPNRWGPSGGIKGKPNRWGPKGGIGGNPNTWGPRG